MPDAAVRRLHRNTPPDRILRRSFLSERRPSGRPKTAYSSVKTVPSRPSAVSLSPHSRRIPSATPPMIWRSKKFIRLIAKSTARANTAPGTKWISGTLEGMFACFDDGIRNPAARADRVDRLVRGQALEARRDRAVSAVRTQRRGHLPGRRGDAIGRLAGVN